MIPESQDCLPSLEDTIGQSLSGQHFYTVGTVSLLCVVQSLESQHCANDTFHSTVTG
jgi:hypothetical protein